MRIVFSLFRLTLLPAFAFLLVSRAAMAADSPAIVWSKVKTVVDVARVFPAPTDPLTAYIWTRTGWFITTDGGATYADLGPGAADQLGAVTALLVDPLHPGVLYAGTDANGVFVSSNGARTWKPLGNADKGLGNPHIHALAFYPYDLSHATIFATHGPKNAGISMSIDGGRTWRKFAEDYGVGDLTMVGSHFFMWGAHPAGGQETGFYRAVDGGKKWFRVLNVENPTSLVLSQLSGKRAWCGTATGGLFVTHDVGVSSKGVGPGDGHNVSSLWAGIGPDGAERILSYDPQKDGVRVGTSADGFQTWKPLNTGLYVNEWVAEGAAMAANANGEVLYACINGELYRGASPASAVGLSSARAEPPAAVLGHQKMTFIAKAAPGSAVTIDLSPIGGPPDLAMQGTDTFSATFEPTGETLKPAIEKARKIASEIDHKEDDEANYPLLARELPVQAGFTVRAVKDGVTQSSVIPIILMPDVQDRMLWDGEGDGGRGAVVWHNDGITGERSHEKPLSGTTSLKLTADGPGILGFSWKGGGGYWDGDEARYHKILSFWICSDGDGPSDLKISLRDDGRKYGSGNGARSNDVSLSAYVPKVGKRYQYVSIPLADLILGSACSPNAIREMVFISTGDGHRVYYIDDIGLNVQGGVRLAGGAVTPGRDGKNVRFSVMAVGKRDASTAISAQANGHAFPLSPDPSRGEDAYSAQAPAADIGYGAVPVTFEAKSGADVSTSIVSAFLPRHEPGVIAHFAGAFHADGDLSVFNGVQSFTASDGTLSVSSRILFGNKHLYVAMEVKDPDATVPKYKGDPDQNALLRGGCVELLLESPAASFGLPRQSRAEQDRQIVFGLGAKDYAWVNTGPHRFRVFGKKTDDGYVIEAEIPFDPALGNGSRQCDFEVGKQTRIEFRLHGQNGKQVAWASSTPQDADNPNNWGVAAFTDEPGPPKLRFGGADGHTLTLISHKPLDPAAAADPNSYRIDGAKISMAEVFGEGRIVHLTTDRAWEPGQTVAVEFPALKSSDGIAPQSGVHFTVLPGHVATAEPIAEYLVGPPVANFPVKDVATRDAGDPKTEPSAGGGWQIARTDERGMLNMALACGGELKETAAPAVVYVYSDSDQSVQVWFGCDDGARVSLNGAFLFANPGQGGGSVDSHKVKDVHLRKGWNCLYTTVENVSGGWGLIMKICDEQGGVPAGVSYAAQKPRR